MAFAALRTFAPEELHFMDSKSDTWVLREEEDRAVVRPNRIMSQCSAAKRKHDQSADLCRQGIKAKRFRTYGGKPTSPADSETSADTAIPYDYTENWCDNGALLQRTLSSKSSLASSRDFLACPPTKTPSSHLEHHLHLETCSLQFPQQHEARLQLPWPSQSSKHCTSVFPPCPPAPAPQGYNCQDRRDPWTATHTLHSPSLAQAQLPSLAIAQLNANEFTNHGALGTLKSLEVGLSSTGPPEWIPPFVSQHSKSVQPSTDSRQAVNCDRNSAMRRIFQQFVSDDIYLRGQPVSDFRLHQAAPAQKILQAHSSQQLCPLPLPNLPRPASKTAAEAVQHWGFVLKLHVDTVHFTQHLYSRLPRQAFSRRQSWTTVLLLLGCLWIACKLEESRLGLPSAQLIANLAAPSLSSILTAAAVNAVEIQILGLLQWQPLAGWDDINHRKGSKLI